MNIHYCAECGNGEERVLRDTWTGMNLCLTCVGAVWYYTTNSPASEGDNLRNELATRVGEGIREAVVQGDRDTLETVQRYMPSNYWATQQPDGSILIRGKDRAGWTLDGYVIPRLASGMIYAKELTEGTTK